MKHKIKIIINGSFIEAYCTCGKEYSWQEIQNILNDVSACKRRNRLERFLGNFINRITARWDEYWN